MAQGTGTEPDDCCTYSEAAAHAHGWQWLAGVGVWVCEHGHHPTTCRTCRDLLPSCCWDRPLRVRGYGTSTPLLRLPPTGRDPEVSGFLAGLVGRRLASLRLPPLWTGHRDPLDRLASGGPSDGWAVP